MKTAAGIAGLVLVMLVASVPAASMQAAAETEPGGRFWDDDGNPHEGWIEAIAAAGITRGCSGDSDDLYCPDRFITRAEMATMLVRALELPPADRDFFSDDAGSFFEADINALAAVEITLGCEPGLFCPDNEVSRSHMAAFLARALELPPGPDRFTDDDGSFFEQSIDAIAAAGVTLGCNPPTGDRFCPESHVRRDQMASFLGRGLGLTESIPPLRPAFTTAFTGDLLLHMPVNDAAAVYGDSSGRRYDFQPMFAPVTEMISAVDLAICHLEVPLSPTSTGLSGYPTFLGPAELARGIASAGYEGCSVASNHSYDRGVQGVFDTLAVLSDAGLAAAGMATSADDRATPQMYTVGDASVAHLSYTYWLNGFRLPADQPWLVDIIDEGLILADAATARSMGADVVIVSMHWGSEYVTMPTQLQTDQGHRLIESDDIDLVVGHHAHVVQPIEKVADEYIVYGLGNFLSNQRTRLPTQDGVIVMAEFALRSDRWVAREVTYTPTWVEAGSFRILPAAETVLDGTWASQEERLTASWNRTHWAINRLGNDASPTAWP